MRSSLAFGGVLAASLCCSALARAEPPASEVVVAGHKPTRPPGEPTLASTRIDAEDLTRPGATAATVLAHVPGVQVAESGGAADLSTASVRGATSAQTPVYLAGIRLNDDVTGTADLSLIPLWMLGRAAVYRGNAPADADRMGIGGAVYFEPRVPRANRISAGAGLGSFGEHAGWLGAEVGHDGNAALIAFRASGARNDYPYLDTAGTGTTNDDRTVPRPNADYSAREVWAIGRTRLGHSGAQLTSVFNAFEREQGVTGLAALPDLSARAQSSRVLAGLSARIPCGSAPVCEVALESQGIVARSRLTDPEQKLGLFTTRLDSRGERWGQGARVTFGSALVRALVGANVELERLALVGNGAPLAAHRTTASGRAGVTVTPIEHSELSALAVYTCDTTSGPARGEGCADRSPEGRLSARQVLGPVELRTNLGRYARVPTLGELYGVSAAVQGSSALVSERGLAWDLGARIEAPLGPVWAYADVFGFVRGVSDLIAYRRTSLGTISPYNVGRARILGAELEAGAQWPEHLRSSLSLTVLDPRDTTPRRALVNDLIPHQSRLQTSAFIEGFADPGLRPLRRAGLDARLTHRASRFADAAGLIVLPASTALDLGASLLFGRPVSGAAGELSLRASVDDVFDARRFDFIGYPLPGRSVHVSLEAAW